MKLFIWKNVFCDYTCGIAFALAETKEQAIDLIKESFWVDSSSIDIELSDDPEIYDYPYGFAIYGGG